MTMNPSSRRNRRSAQPHPPPPPFRHQRQYSDTSALLRQQQEDHPRNFLRVGEPSNPLASSRSSSMRKDGDVGEQENATSLGILDLQSFDSELLPDFSGKCDNPFTFSHNRGQSFDDADPNILPNRAHQSVDSKLMKNFSENQEKMPPVAKIKVVVRKRPLNKKEISKKEDDIITISAQTNSLLVHERKLKVDLTEYVERHEFVFDAVLSEKVSNDEVYRKTVEPIVPTIFQRTKATCFAYGQTGSGKTYTMQPLPLRASQDILRLMHYTYQNQGFQLFVSFFEIYGGKLFDLLNDRRKLFMREDGKQQVCIVGLQEYKVFNVEAIGDLIETGNATRSTGTTGANEESSRSHAILQLVIKRHADGNESKPPRVVGKLSFIDLAGSERGADTTDNDKQTRIEGAEINKSLLALKECIRALDNDQIHIPFRGSKLTEVLRDSFIGNSRTVMISCVSPNSGSCEHTLNTLRYADRVKGLSKGSNPKKDPSAVAAIKEPNVEPVAAALPVENNNVHIPNETNESGWTKKMSNETLLPPNTAHIFSGREQGRQVKEPLRDHSRRSSMTGEDFDLSGSYDLDKPNGRGNSDACRVIRKEDRLLDPEMKWKDADLNSIQLDDELDTLLKEEEDLVVFHRRLVEETIDTVREEMKLLMEAEQPGNQLDDYLSKLSVILSRKASGITKLQARLSNFQRLLNENNVLLIPSDP